jgi:HEPN domain-containing protein
LARLALPDHQVLRNQVAFHAQQAAEKAIKAVLAHRGVHFPRTHDLEALLEIVHLTGITWPFATAEVEALTPFAVETRYPGCVAQVTDPEARQAIEAAEQVLRWARSLAH